MDVPDRGEPITKTGNRAVLSCSHCFGMVHVHGRNRIDDYTTPAQWRGPRSSHRGPFCELVTGRIWTLLLQVWFRCDHATRYPWISGKGLLSALTLQDLLIRVQLQIPQHLEFGSVPGEGVSLRICADRSRHQPHALSGNRFPVQAGIVQRTCIR